MRIRAHLLMQCHQAPLLQVQCHHRLQVSLQVPLLIVRHPLLQVVFRVGRCCLMWLRVASCQIALAPT